MADLAAQPKVHPNMIAQWKRKAADRDQEVKELHAKIGQLTGDKGV